jgi:hypothetical protein
MPFCYSPWTNLDIDPAGTMSPCCKFQRKYYTETFNIQTDSINAYLGSDFLRTVQQDFTADRWPLGCERCKIEEQHAIASKRQLDLARWQQHYDQYQLDCQQFITASVAFGNTCNLKCITCSSYSSSRWQQEYREIYNVDYPHVKFYRQDFVERFTELAPGLLHLDIPGGEPFLSGVTEQQQLLQHYIDSGRADQMTLHYTTNGTVFPNTTWWQLWKHFKQIDLQISIDGVGSRYEYLRFPAKWPVLVSNVHEYMGAKQQNSNVQISISHTVSAYNVYYLDEFFSWCYNIGLPRPWLGRVHSPAHMRPTVWPLSARQAIVEQLSRSPHADVLVWAELMTQSDDSEQFDEFSHRCRQHDQYRSTDFKQTFPELACYL